MKKFILFFLYTISVVFCYGQTAEKPKPQKGIEIGCNLAPLITHFVNKSESGFDLSVQADLKKNFYVLVQGGMLNLNEEKALFSYKSSGSFITAGIDYNIFKRNPPNLNNQILFGVAYGFSSLKHQADMITINSNRWPDYHGSFPSTPVKAQWLEVNAAVKAEVLRNFSVGWMVKLNFLVTSSGMENSKPYQIPGYGNGKNNISLTYTYSLYYRIPFY